MSSPEPQIVVREVLVAVLLAEDETTTLVPVGRVGPTAGNLRLLTRKVDPTGEKHRTTWNKYNE